MDGVFEFILELALEIFAGIAEAIIPDHFSKPKRVVITVFSVLLGIVFCICLILGAAIFIIGKDRILGLVLFALGLGYIAFAIAISVKSQKKLDISEKLSPITDEIYKSTVYPIYVKYRYRKLLTLTYYTENGDGIIHSEKNLLWFTNTERMCEFCKEFKLNLDYDDKEEIYTFDYDEKISDPIDFNEVLCNWNLLNTMATSLKMEFEGDKEKYSELYDLLFRLCTPAEPTERTTYEVGKKNVSTIRKLFKNIILYFNKFEYYR